jgi:uncharacterized protein YuzE
MPMSSVIRRKSRNNHSLPFLTRKDTRLRHFKMRITYDKKAGAPNIVFQRKGKYNEEIGEGVIVDYTKRGKIISIEILDVSKRMPREALRRFQFRD